ncbi:MAG: CPBP family intramembrane metalloprotease [Candidatus Bathyarchaeota archaeon]|nr:MAG: CPBP family intramembrane metalloprotease [Candidatus Bathyarchaeota archaeon]
MMTFSEPKSLTKTTLTFALVIAVLILLFSYFLAIFLGPILMFSSDGLAAIYKNLQPPILLFIVIGFIAPVNINVGWTFLILWGVFAICFVAALRLREPFHNAIEKGFSGSVGKLFDNWLFAMPVITSMMLVAVLAIHLFQESQGIPTGDIQLPSNRFESLFELSYAALIEEIGFRITPIGAFLIIHTFLAEKRNERTLSLRQRLKLFFAAPLFPDEAKEMVGMKTVSNFGVRGGISIGEWAMVFLTSIVFGLAHYLSGGGWEIGKATSASAVGVAMGLTYLLYGVQAPILLHWFFNYYTYALSFASELYSTVFITSVLADLVTIVLGVLGWLTIPVLALLRIFRARSRKAETELSLLQVS